MTPLLLGLALVSGQSNDPVKSSGPWVARYEDQMCVLSRPYGAGPASVRLALRSMPGDDFIEIVLISRNAEKAFSRAGKASVELLPSGQTAAAHYRDYPIMGGTKRMVRFFVTRSAIGDLATSTSLRIGLDKETRHLALTRTGNALNAIEACEDEMLRDWGVDPQAMRNIATPPRPLTPEQSWLWSSDYPAHALSRSQASAVRLRWTVDASGTVKDCTIVQSSGHAVLDKTSCDRITERGRYEPAIDTLGKPVASFRTKTVQWSVMRMTLKQSNGG